MSCCLSINLDTIPEIISHGSERVTACKKIKSYTTRNAIRFAKVADPANGAGRKTTQLNILYHTVTNNTRISGGVRGRHFRRRRRRVLTRRKNRLIIFFPVHTTSNAHRIYSFVFIRIIIVIVRRARDRDFSD